ncbi:hypothetical protein J6X13_03785 [Candidatus Saccharibacteria bacterium]|nr:hypothetical protein [Candidatus Saccharibacteria bacterium]
MIIWNAKRISEILSSFDLSEVSYLEVSAYYFWSLTGEGYYTQLAGNYDFCEDWTPRTWRRVIRRAPVFEFDIKDLIGCLRIEFSYGTRYVLEMTDVFKGYFDQITVRQGNKIKEIHLTPEESKKIKGVKDVVKLVENMPIYRFKEFSCKPPEVVGKRRKLVVSNRGALEFIWA